MKDAKRVIYLYSVDKITNLVKIGRNAFQRLVPNTCFKFSTLPESKPFLSGIPVLINTGGRNDSIYNKYFYFRN